METIISEQVSGITAELEPFYTILWQLKHNKNIDVKFVTEKDTTLCTDAKLTGLRIGDMTLNNTGTILYVLVPDSTKDMFALIEDREFIQRFHDVVDLSEKL